MYEIKELKSKTDKSIKEATDCLEDVERKQQYRKTSAQFFVTCVPTYDKSIHQVT